MILAAGVKVEGRKSQVLAELAVSINKVVSYFHCALRYTANHLPELSLLIEKGGISESTLRELLFLETLPTDCKDRRYYLLPALVTQYL